MDDRATMSCSSVMVWLRVMSDGEAARVVAPHLDGCPTCQRRQRGLARLTRWIGSWRLGSTPFDLIREALAARAARTPIT